MNGNKKLPKADKFLENRKKTKLWHRLLLIAGSVVVFITTYMLILPALTAEIGTLDVYDHVLSSAGVEVDNGDVVYDDYLNSGKDDDSISQDITEDSVEVTEESTISIADDDKSTGGGGGGGSSGSVGDKVVSEDVTMDISLEKVDSDKEKEKEDPVNVLNNLVSMLANVDNSGLDSIKFYGSGENQAYEAVYDTETGDFKVQLNVDFIINKDSLIPKESDTTLIPIPDDADDYTLYYAIQLPKGVTIPQDMVYDSTTNTPVYKGYKTGTTIQILQYCFVPTYNENNNPITDDYGNPVYTVNMVFSKDFVDTLVDSNIVEGTMDVNAHLSTKYYSEEDGTITIKDGDDDVIKVDWDKIKYNDNETLLHDITVKKNGTYNSSDKTITYTVMVMTKKGTGDTVTVNDTLDSTFLNNLGAELQSIEYKQGTVGLNSQWDSVYDGNTQYSESVQLTQTDAGTGYTYDDDGNLIINLPGLEKSDGGKYETWDENAVNANAYCITYTYKINPQADATYTGNNTARADVVEKYTDHEIVISDSSTATVTVTGKTTLAKFGSYDKENQKITWTITAGDGENSIKGFDLNDIMFADANGDIKVTDVNGNEMTADTDYTFIYDTEDNTKITGIKLSHDDSADKTKTKYIITYSTPATQQWAGQSITNDVTLKSDDPDSSEYTAKATVNIGGLSNCFTKKFSSAEKGENSLYTLNWIAEFDIPVSGITKGITFTDYVSGDGHYITKDQADSITTALKDTWGEGNIENIQFYAGTDRWNMKEDLWVNSENLAEYGVYYQFRYTIANDILYDPAATGENANKISYTYPTTADTSGIGNADNIIYYNNVYDSVAKTEKSANWTYYKEVVKYGNNVSGGISSSDDTTITITDDKVSWTARVVLLPGQTYEIVDSLPDGLELVGIYADTNTTAPKNELATTTNASIELKNNVSGTVVLTYDGTNESNEVSLTAFNDATNRNMLYVRYLCKIEDLNSGTNIGAGSEGKEEGTVVAGSIAKQFVYPNNVTVTTDSGEEYGRDSQTTTVIWQDQAAAEEILSKDAQFDTDNNVIKYSLDINSNAINYVTSTNEAYSDIVLTDILSYSSYPSAGIARDASLMLSSVSLYYALEDEQGNIIQTDGKLVKGAKLSASDYTWTYDVSVNSNGYDERSTKTLTLTVPNGTALVFEYEFLVTLITDEKVVNPDRSANVENIALLSVGGETIVSTTTVKTTDKVEDSGTSASANGSAGYTIYKVDKNNFSMPLEGAEFDLYVWSNTTDTDGNVTGKGFNKIDTFTTSSQGYTGITGTLKTNNDTGEKWYEIKLSDGSAYNLPVDTICYFVESKAPEGYKLDSSNKYYFYFGSSVATRLDTVLNNCGYNGADTISSAFNLITSHTQYITNEHSWDYFAEKTGISVVKRWLDSTGNEINKSDGSIAFRLYRVFTNTDGIQTTDPNATGGGDEDDPVTNPTIKVNVKVGRALQGINGAAYDDAIRKEGSIEVQNVDGAKVDITIKRQSWSDGGILSIYDIDTKQKLVDDITITKSDPYEYTYTLDVGGKNRNIFLCAQDNFIWGLEDFLALSSEQEVVETTTEPTSEAVTSDPETESTTTALYYHVFDDDVLEFSTYSAGNDVEISHINGDWLVYKKGTERTDPVSANYFTINGSLSQSHGTALWDLDGDGSIDADSETLETCLKMETNYNKTGTGTNISFTANEGGIITLVFNANGNGNESSTIVNGVYIDDKLYSATNNIVSIYLDAGTHTITRSNYCFIFYMSFEEGASESSTVSSQYVHNFNNGLSSTFYTIEGKTANNKGAIKYENIDITTCLKMNSKASVTFDTEEAGTIYLILTNPNNNPEVGLVIDGNVHYASHELDPNGNDIYTVTARLSEGSHKISRINATEAMLYYIEYVPDDFGTGEITSTAPSNKLAELVGEYTISAANNWSWSTTNLPWQVLYENGDLRGHYSYFVVEVDNQNKYVTQYLNSKSDGIQSGSMAIYNQDHSDSATEITVNKNWLNVDGNPLGADLIPDSITYSLYSRVNVNDGMEFSGGEEHSRSTAVYQDNPKLKDDSDGFFTITGSINSSNDVGQVTFNTEKSDKVVASKYLKFEGSTEVKFSSPATSGILTLVTYNWSAPKNGFESVESLGFVLVSPDGKQHAFNYSTTADNHLSGDYLGNSNSNAKETLVSDNAGVTITPTKTGTTPSGSGIITFTIFLDKAGEWTIKKNGAQEYLYYMDYSYQYKDLADGEGIFVNDYTITANDNGEWTQTVSGLPYIIYDDNGAEVGHYSYYIEEKDIEGFKLDTLTYSQVDDNGEVESTGPITGGSVDITNRQKNVSVLLPESGGIGTDRYIKTGLLMCICAGLLIYIRSKKLRE